MAAKMLRLLRVQDGEKLLLAELREISGHDQVEVQKKDDSIDIILEYRPPKAAAEGSRAAKSTAKKSTAKKK